MAAPPQMAILPSTVETLLSTETNPLRFERVCANLYSASEGITIVSTARTWDRGRDGRDIAPPPSGHNARIVLSATLAAHLDDKVEHDLRRLAETTRTEQLVYCTSTSLSEQGVDQISARVREVLPDTKSVVVLGLIQLADLGYKFPDIIRKHYPAEIAHIETTLLREPFQGAPEQIALRLALMTQTGDDARELRKELLERLVLETLNAKGALTAEAIGSAISQQLHLGTAIAAAYVEPAVRRLRSVDLVTCDGATASLTLGGLERANSIPAEAPRRFLEGRAAIREAIATLSGHQLVEDHFERVWNRLLDGLAELFYSQGEVMVAMVRSILGEAARAKVVEKTHLERLGDSILPLFSDGTQGEEVRQAVIDMFSESGTPAWEWLTHLCAVYVIMCSLGLEARSGEAATSTLRQYALVIDTDIALSLLCEGEANASHVRELVAGWRSAGGTLLLARPVLEEVAYHAWIAEQEFRFVKAKLSTISDGTARHMISNAFVRTFRAHVLASTPIRQWDRFIKQFRGEREYDYGPVLDVLREEYGFEELPSAGSEMGEFRKDVAKFVHNKLAADLKRDPEELDYKAEDKCRRDGVLLGDIKNARDRARGAKEGRPIVLSSSRYMRSAAQRFASKLGKPDAVLMPGALGCLLMLLPGTRLGVRGLRGVLFDTRVSAKLTSVEGYAYRLIAMSGEYDMPWSRRGSLRRELGERFLADARASGQPVKQIRKKVLGSENPEFSAKMVSEALREMALPPESRAELNALRVEVSRLKAELAEGKRLVRSPRR
jgi:hypothetical protein